MRVRFDEGASLDVDEAVGWYEAHEPGLGAEFLSEVDRAIAVLCDWPEAWALWPRSGARRKVRRFLLSRFPYAVAFQVRKGEIVVLAVAHHRRRPGYWRRRKG